MPKNDTPTNKIFDFYQSSSHTSSVVKYTNRVGTSTTTMVAARDDAVDEENIVLCCAVCCANIGWYADADCVGCSGKAGLCCLNMEFCCKPSAPCLPCICCGPRCENDGCSVLNLQCQACNLVASAALPCNKEVPVAVSAFGVTVYPKCGCCLKIGDLKAPRGASLMERC